jgi:ATP adenylyltransferase
VVSSKKPETLSGSCCLCSQIEGDARGDLLHRWLRRGEYERTVADLAASWHAIPSIGALVPGHSLLCPRAHARSLASAMRSDWRGATESLAVLDSALSACFGGPVQLFEHGNAADGERLACSVEHAHLHIVPGVPDLWPFIDSRVVWQPIAGIADLPEATGRSEYLLFRDSSAAWWVARAPSDGHPSQLMRRAVAAAIGEPDEWNWRLHPRLEQTQATAEAVLALR